METRTDNRTKSWLYRLRFLKIFKRDSNGTTDQNKISPSESGNITTFRRSLVSNTLNGASPEVKRNETTLRKSLRKWHKRMKNCFSGNNLHVPQRHSTHIVHEVLPIFSLSNTADPFQNENVYSIGPFTERIPVSVSPSSSSRLTEGTESLPRSPAFSHKPHTNSDRTPKNEVFTLAHHVWYWGPVPKSLVEAKLHGAPDGSFLVRDSASDRHIFSISFRSVGRTLHVRIEHTNNGYRVFDHKGFTTVKELIEEAVRISTEDGLFCYTKSRGDEPNFPVRLLKPISRYDEVRSLQNLSRFVIRQHINVNDVEKLSLPSTLISFLKEENYF